VALEAASTLAALVANSTKLKPPLPEVIELENRIHLGRRNQEMAGGKPHARNTLLSWPFSSFSLFSNGPLRLIADRATSRGLRPKK